MQPVRTVILGWHMSWWAFLAKEGFDSAKTGRLVKRGLVFSCAQGALSFFSLLFLFPKHLAVFFLGISLVFWGVFCSFARVFN